MKPYVIIILALVVGSVLALGVVATSPVQVQDRGEIIHAFKPCDCSEKCPYQMNEISFNVQPDGDVVWVPIGDCYG